MALSPVEKPETSRRIPVPATTNVLGVGVSALDLDGAVDLIADAVRSREKGYICVCGVHGLIECRRDTGLQQIHNTAMAVVPDGMPLVWALHAGGHPAAGRVYGPDLMKAVFADGLASNTGHFLYGTTPAALALLKRNLMRRFPGVRITGTYAPPFRKLTPDEEAHISAVINASKPDLVWVGLSTPKQEKWMAAMRPRLDAPVILGVGAAFDFIGGSKRSAPSLLQKAGLEWGFRLVTEPRRLWRRYARIVPFYLFLRALQKTGFRQFPMSPDEFANGKPGKDN